MDSREEKEAPLVKQIKQIVDESKGRYGYRRIQAKLRQLGWIVNHKRLLRLMRYYGLKCKKFMNRSRRKYNSYRGNIGTVAPNHTMRKFKTDSVNRLWLTDVTEFSLPIPGQKLYLSPIMDAYHSEIISYKLSHSPTINIILEPLNTALIEQSIEPDMLVFHSDQGFQYRHQTIVQTLADHKVKQSMSRKGNCLDNAPMENFFGLLKQEMFYGETFESYEALETAIHEYIHFYNHQRIKTKLKGMSPVQFRKHTLKSV